MAARPVRVDSLQYRTRPPSQVNHPTPTPAVASDDSHRDDVGLVRSASSISLSGQSSEPTNLKRTFSDNALVSLAQRPTTVTPSIQTANTELFRRASQKANRRMSNVKAGNAQKTTNDDWVDSIENGKSLGRSVTGTIRGFARKSWMPGSRENSPQRRESTKLRKERSISLMKPDRSLNTSTNPPEPTLEGTSPQIPPQVESLLVKDEDLDGNGEDLTHMPAISEVSADPESETTSSKGISRSSSATSLRSKASNDGMYLKVRSQIPPMPVPLSSDRSSSPGTEVATKKDPLWSAFRAIDGEYGTFHAKTSLQKAKVIRSVLLPFLAKHASDSSISSLRVEDLDRRIAILNKWWMGLLDILNGLHNQSLSGTDRPSFLEAMTELMIRPEWRIPPYLLDNPPMIRKVFKTHSYQSAESDDSDFLVGSIHQNIRNIFIQNLLCQMAFVVEKLSMRSAPASLVTFSGKACAYAFFFCPGVGDTLCRLWQIPPGTLRRVFTEYNRSNGQKAGFISHELASFFPPPVRSLCCLSQGRLARHIQHKAQTPPGTSGIRWYGPWVNRWIGRDSDLFFVFTKHYHLLLSWFIPRSLSVEERVSLPGFAPVHAQILMVLESTLYRQTGHFAVENYVSMSAGENPETIATLPMLIPNATRSIAENRLVMLMRDLINDSKAEHAHFVELLVGSFQFTLKAATRKVSMYNTDACFVLCDFLEEVMPMLSKYHQSHTVIEDWPFWLQVFKQMLRSQTTTIHVRIMSFLYSMWTFLVCTPERKEEMALKWLLDPEIFDQFFNHWSPLVRNYYYRLICWRIARCDGLASKIDLQIVQTLAIRLKKCWGHHQYLNADADMRQISPPPTTPCYPAPGRMLVIVRTDSQPTTSSFFTSFEKILQHNEHTPYISHSSVLNKLPEPDTPQINSKKRWSILKGIGLFNSSVTGRPGEVTPPRSPDSVPSTSKLRPLNGRASNPPSRPTTPPYQPLSFKFSLEHAGGKLALPPVEGPLPMPSLPHSAQKLMNQLDLLDQQQQQQQQQVHSRVKPLKPSEREMKTARYSGRALSEWNLVVSECRNFYARRRQEGCPRDDLVETPTLAVEMFRMFG